MRYLLASVAAWLCQQLTGNAGLVAPSAATWAGVRVVPQASSSLAIELPALASQPVRLRDPDSGVSIAFAAIGARPAKARRDGASISFPGAIAGARMSLHVSPTGVEDFTHFDSKPKAEEAHYSLALEQAAGLRLVDDVLEVLDRDGVPRLRMNRPWIRDRYGTAHRLKVSVTGCMLDQSPVAPWGRTPTPPAASSCEIHLSWADRAIRYPAVLDPAWSSTDELVTPRILASLCRTGDGLALLAGGIGFNEDATAAELYDSLSGKWSPTAPLPRPRFESPCVTLADKRTLLAGGYGADVLPDAATYDPVLGTWTDSMLVAPRYDHTLTALPDGRVLAAGGNFQLPSGLSTAELYDPMLDSWSPAGDLLTYRYGHSAGVLPDGRVLIAGGTYQPGGTSNTEIFDPSTNTAQSATPMAFDRDRFQLVSVGGSYLAIAGTAQGNPSSEVEAFDPVQGIWQARAPLPLLLEDATAVPLPSGRVLLFGGGNEIAYWGGSLAYDPALDGWQSAGAVSPRIEHSALALSDGRVLAAGGHSRTVEFLPEVMIFEELALGSPCLDAGACASSHCRDGICCASECDGACEVCSADGACEAVESADDADSCSGAATCSAEGACLPAPGEACAAPGECASGHCVDGVCCDRSCDAACEACDGADQGTCGPVVGEPHGDRPSCVAGSVCDGISTICVGLSLCEDGHVAVAADGARDDCAPYACDANGACLAQCADVSGCAEPFLCDTTGHCVEPSFEQPEAGCAVTRRPARSGGALWLVSAFAIAARLRRIRDYARSSRTGQRVNRRPRWATRDLRACRAAPPASAPAA